MEIERIVRMEWQCFFSGCWLIHLVPLKVGHAGLSLSGGGRIFPLATFVGK